MVVTVCSRWVLGVRGIDIALPHAGFNTSESLSYLQILVLKRVEGCCAEGNVVLASVPPVGGSR